MRYVIVDLEATCWEKGTSREKMEIIEIGAVLLASGTGPVSKEFVSFIKPVATQELSAFCTELTTIRQEDVDQAEYFWTVFPQFVEWIGEEPFRLCSWGAYDLNQFRTDCERHKMPLPASFENHINLKREFSRLKNVKPMGMKGALAMMDIPLVGTHHRGIDDAQNIAKLAQIILPAIEAEAESLPQ
jgi:3'-5' exoribonuclease 1